MSFQFLIAFSYSVENAYMEEKEDTINSFVEIVENIGLVFTQHFWFCKWMHYQSPCEI